MVTLACSLLNVGGLQCKGGQLGEACQEPARGEGNTAYRYTLENELTAHDTRELPTRDSSVRSTFLGHSLVASRPIGW